MNYSYAKLKRSEEDTGNRPYLLIFLLTVVMLVFNCRLQEGIAFYRGGENTVFNEPEFYLYFGITVCLLALCYIVAIKKWGLRVHWGWAIMFLIIGIGNTLAILLFPSEVSGTVTRYTGDIQPYTYVMDDTLRVHYMLDYIEACFLFYYLFAIFPEVVRSSRSFLPIFYGVVIVSLVSIGYSIFKEMDVYMYFFDTSKPANSSIYASSFYGNRNTYGVMLLLGILCTAYIHADRHHFWNYILMGFQYVMLLFVISKTSIFISTVFLAVFGLYRFFDNIHSKHVFKATLSLLLWAAVFFTFVFMGTKKMLPKGSLLDKLYESFHSAMGTYRDNGLENRTEIWNACVAFQSSNHIALWLGVGEQNDYLLLNVMFQYYNQRLYFEHNGFIHQLFSGGIVRLTAYSIITFLLVYKSIISIIKKEKTGWASLFLLSAFYAHGLTETTSFLMPDTKGVVTILLIGPLLACSKKRATSVNEGEAN